jgi:hypothetical protein
VKLISHINARNKLKVIKREYCREYLDFKGKKKQEDNYNEELHNLHCAPYIKAIPLQAWTGPEGCKSLRFPSLKKINT